MTLKWTLWVNCSVFGRYVHVVAVILRLRIGRYVHVVAVILRLRKEGPCMMGITASEAFLPTEMVALLGCYAGSYGGD